MILNFNIIGNSINKTMYFPLKQNRDQRTHESFIENSLEGTEKKPVFGLKGYSILNNFISFPKAAPYDYMHLVFEGIFKKMFSFWFDTSNKEKEYYIGFDFELI